MCIRDRRRGVAVGAVDVCRALAAEFERDIAAQTRREVGAEADAAREAISRLVAEARKAAAAVTERARAHERAGTAKAVDTAGFAERRPVALHAVADVGAQVVVEAFADGVRLGHGDGRRNVGHVLEAGVGRQGDVTCAETEFGGLRRCTADERCEGDRRDEGRREFHWVLVLVVDGIRSRSQTPERRHQRHETDAPGQTRATRTSLRGAGTPRSRRAGPLT